MIFLEAENIVISDDFNVLKILWRAFYAGRFRAVWDKQIASHASNYFSENTFQFVQKFRKAPLSVSAMVKPLTISAIKLKHFPLRGECCAKKYCYITKISESCFKARYKVYITGFSIIFILGKSSMQIKNIQVLDLHSNSYKRNYWNLKTLKKQQQHY